MKKNRQNKQAQLMSNQVQLVIWLFKVPKTQVEVQQTQVAVQQTQLDIILLNRLQIRVLETGEVGEDRTEDQDPRGVGDQIEMVAKVVKSHFKVQKTQVEVQ